jgi:hypothetical protein
VKTSLLCIGCIIILAACQSPAPAVNTPSPANWTFEQLQWTQTHTRQVDIAVEGDQLHITLKQPDTLAWSVAGLALDDLVLEADATQVEGPDDNGYGLIVRRVDDENFYSFQVSGDGYFLVQKRLKGRWVKLGGDWQASPAIHTGATTNHLRVTCQGHTFTFDVNGEQVAQLTDGDLRSGDVGVIAGSLLEPGVHVAFGNVTVKRSE